MFEVIGTDRGGVAQIEMQTNTGSLRDQLMLFRQEDLGKLPRLMKRLIRAYLDALAEEILKPKPKVVEEKITPVAEEPSAQAEALKSADLFEDAVEEDILETLPQLNELEALK